MLQSMRQKPEFITDSNQIARKISSLHVYLAKTVLSRDRLERMFADERARMIAEHSRTINELKSAHAAQIAELQSLHAAQIAKLQSLHAEQIDRLTNELGKTSSELALARGEIARLEALIDSITHSASWRITTPLRAVSAWMRGPRSPDLSSNAGATARSERSTDRLAELDAIQPEPAAGVDTAPSESDAVSEELAPVEEVGMSNSAGQAVPQSDDMPRRPTLADPAFETGGKEAWDARGKAELSQFLADNQHLVFPANLDPQLSIILVLYNKAHLSLLSLLALHKNADVAYETIIVDNNSTDETTAVLARLQNVTIIRNTENVGFAAGCMQGVARSTGKYLCFLNNDALVQPKALSIALSNFDEHSTGAVGGKILLANGMLQEAGCILWSSGTTEQYGHGDDPEKPQYNFRRPVDYCSGAFLFTPTQLFNDLGGFDERFALGYWEDSDYCLRVWQAGYRVTYEPRAVIRHYESASGVSIAATIDYIITNHGKFVEKWENLLPEYYEPQPSNQTAARIAAADERPRILFIDERVPRKSAAEASRSFEVLSLLAQGGIVACAAWEVPPVAADREGLPLEIELVDATGNRENTLLPYLRDADVVWVSRERILAELIPLVGGTSRRNLQIMLDDGVEHPTGRSLPDFVFRSGQLSEELLVIRDENIVVPLACRESNGCQSATEEQSDDSERPIVRLRVVS